MTAFQMHKLATNNLKIFAFFLILTLGFVSLHAEPGENRRVNAKYKELYKKYYSSSRMPELRLSNSDTNYHARGCFNGKDEDVISIFPVESSRIVSTDYNDNQIIQYSQLLLKSKYGTVPDPILDMQVYDNEHILFAFPLKTDCSSEGCSSKYNISKINERFEPGGKSKDALLISIHPGESTIMSYATCVLNNSGHWEMRRPLNAVAMTFGECKETWREWLAKHNGKFNAHTRISVEEEEGEGKFSSRFGELALFPVYSDIFSGSEIGKSGYPVYMMKFSEFPIWGLIEGNVNKIFPAHDNSTNRDLIVVEYSDSPKYHGLHQIAYYIGTGYNIDPSYYNDIDIYDDNGYYHDLMKAYCNIHSSGGNWIRMPEDYKDNLNDSDIESLEYNLGEFMTKQRKNGFTEYKWNYSNAAFPYYKADAHKYIYGQEENLSKFEIPGFLQKAGVKNKDLCKAPVDSKEGIIISTSDAKRLLENVTTPWEKENLIAVEITALRKIGHNIMVTFKVHYDNTSSFYSAIYTPDGDFVDAIYLGSGSYKFNLHWPDNHTMLLEYDNTEDFDDSERQNRTQNRASFLYKLTDDGFYVSQANLHIKDKEEYYDWYAADPFEFIKHYPVSAPNYDAWETLSSHVDGEYGEEYGNTAYYNLRKGKINFLTWLLEHPESRLAGRINYDCDNEGGYDSSFYKLIKSDIDSYPDASARYTLSKLLLEPR